MKTFKLSKSPFLKKGSTKPSVYLERGDDAYINTINALKNIDLSSAKGKKVLLKPNAGRLAKPGNGVTTNPQVVAAAIDVFQKVGAEVVIAESPITGINTMEAFDITGIAQVANERNCPLIDMDARKCIDIELPNGIAINSLKLCPEISEYDIIVSIPVMKMHMHTGVTVAIKNMKGCLWRRSKVKLHMLPPVENIDERPLNIAIADMSEVLRPHLSIVDGSIGLEGLGPSAGTPKKLGVVLVGIDAFAIDAVACELMGTSAKKIPHLYLGFERGFGEINIDKIDVFPNNWRDYSKNFIQPPENIAINFPGVNIFDKNSCSACQSTLLLFMKNNKEFIKEYYPEKEDINIAIGKGHNSLPKGTLCIGNCTIKHRNAGIFIKGCPPVSSEIINCIKKQKDKKNEV